MTLHTGQIIREYGPFRLREQFLLRDDGERRDTGFYAIRFVLGHSEEEGITVLDRRHDDLAHVAHRLVRWLQGQQGTIASWERRLAQAHLPGATEELQARLDADRSTKWDRENLHTAEAVVAGWQAELQRVKGQHERVERALRELEGQYPALEEEVHRVDEEVRAEEAEGIRRYAERAREARKWWVMPITLRDQAHVELGAVVARHGRFRLHAATFVFEDGHRYRAGGYRIQLDPELEGEQGPALVAAGAFGPPYTPRTDRETAIEYIGKWLDELRASMEQAKQFLGETADPELARRIREGLVERQRQYTLVEHALRELETADHGTPK